MKYSSNQTVAFFSCSVSVIVLFGVVTFALKQSDSSPHDTTGKIEKPGASGLNTLTETKFPGTALPSGWKTSGGPWIINNAAIPPAIGNYETILSYHGGGSGASTLDQETISAQVELTSAKSIFAICTQGTYGTIGEVDGVNNVLRFYLSWGGGKPAGILGTTPIPFRLKRKHRYWITLEKAIAINGQATEHRYTLAIDRCVEPSKYFLSGVLSRWCYELAGPYVGGSGNNVQIGKDQGS